MFNVGWSPWSETWSELNRLQNQARRQPARQTDGDYRRGAAGYPPVNVWADDQRLYVEAELPGIDSADLEIVVNKANQLTLSGQRREPVSQGGSWYRRERGYGTFQRVIDLPVEVDAEQVSAHFKHGVLRIELPKAAAHKPRRIAVHAG